MITAVELMLSPTEAITIAQKKASGTVVKAKLDTDAMGEKVIEILRNAYEKEEIAKAYNKRFAEKVFGYPCDYTIINENGLFKLITTFAPSEIK